MNNNASFMLDYLRYATEMERYKYVWEKSLNTVSAQMSTQVNNLKNQQMSIEMLQASYNSVNQDVAMERQDYAKKVEADRKNSTHGGIWGTFYIKYFIGMGIIGAIVLLILILTGKTSIFPDFSTIFMAALPPILGVVCVVVAISLLYRKRFKKGGDHLNSSYWTKEVDARKRRCLDDISSCKMQITQINAKIEYLQRNRSVIQKNLREVNDKLTDLYSMNVLPAKYRNLACVATLYDYLNTGRCTVIQGHGGIYDTFEYECRLNMIVTTLQDISSKLDTVISNQYTLYNELQIANSHLSQINKTLSNIETSNKAIAANTAATAVATQQIAAVAQYEAWRSRFS